MGRFVAQRAVKLMINAGIQLKGARIGIIGITFKEDVTDTRNSRVPDIAYELSEFGIEPVVYDPVADPELVRHEYGIELKQRSELDGVQGLIVAVGHKQVRDLGIDTLVNFISPGGIFVDIKSIFNASKLPNNISYWSL
jgi:UDP-N-acetyl-D-galactosamine dehydrogenase